MNPDTYFKYVNDTAELLRKNRPMWYRMSQDGIASWRYLKLLSQGEYARPDIVKLKAIQDYIRAAKRAA